MEVPFPDTKSLALPPVLDRIYQRGQLRTVLALLRLLSTCVIILGASSRVSTEFLAHNPLQHSFWEGMLGNNPNELERANTNLKNILPGAKKGDTPSPFTQSIYFRKVVNSFSAPF